MLHGSNVYRVDLFNRIFQFTQFQLNIVLCPKQVEVFHMPRVELCQSKAKTNLRSKIRRVFCPKWSVIVLCFEGERVRFLFYALHGQSVCQDSTRLRHAQARTL